MSIEVDPDWWKSLFDEVYLITDARSVCNEALTSREVSLLCELIPVKATHRILDLCGGHGRHALELSRRGFGRCTVLDYSQTLLQTGACAARQCRLPVTFIKGDARQLPIPRDSYEHVMILGNSLGYAGHQGADIEIVKEAYRILKRDGWLLVDVTDGQAVRRHFTANAWHEIGDDVVVCRQRQLGQKTIRAREMVINKKSGLLRDKTYRMRLYTSDELTEMVASVGFFDVTAHTDFSLIQSKEDLGFMNHRMLITAQKV